MTELTTQQFNTQRALRWFEEIWNRRQVATIYELLTADSVCHSDGGDLRGPEVFRERVYQPFVDAFPDLQLQVEGVISEGSQVVVRWNASGTHSGDGLGITPTGRAVTFAGMTWFRFDDGKIVEGRDCWNIGGLMACLHAPPA